MTPPCWLSGVHDFQQAVFNPFSVSLIKTCRSKSAQSVYPASLQTVFTKQITSVFFVSITYYITALLFQPSLGLEQHPVHLTCLRVSSCHRDREVLWIGLFYRHASPCHVASVKFILYININHKLLDPSWRQHSSAEPNINLSCNQSLLSHFVNSDALLVVCRCYNVLWTFGVGGHRPCWLPGSLPQFQHVCLTNDVAVCCIQ